MTAPVHIYGIKNCDTMKKAFAWLERRGIAYVFHDYKKSGADEGILRKAIKLHGWENVLNRRGATWRALPGRARETMDEPKALEAALESPSLIRRPLLVRGDVIHLGFGEKDYEAVFPGG